MDDQKAITVNIINRNYPPNPGITGESAAELAAFLKEKGLRINVIHVDAEYQKNGQALKPIGNSYPIKTFYNGKNKFLRLFSNLYESIRLLRKSRSLKPTLTICMTEPPLLSVCAAMMLPKKEKWILWAMDLYPEALSAGKIITMDHWIYKMVDSVVKKNKPDHIIALGDHQANYLKSKFSDLDVTVLPCGIYDLPPGSFSRPHWACEEKKIILGYCGNLGEAHSDEFVFSVINNLNPAKHKLILAVYGSKAQKVLQYAKGKPAVEIVEFVKRSELGYIDVHLASLHDDWVNVCVPSKTVSSVCSGSAFLYYGKNDSDNWQLLKEAGWLLSNESTDDLEVGVAALLDQITTSIPEKKRAAGYVADRLHKMKKDAFERIYSKIVYLSSAKQQPGKKGSDERTPSVA
jgi:hypothetical protein